MSPPRDALLTVAGQISRITIARPMRLLTAKPTSEDFWWRVHALLDWRKRPQTKVRIGCLDATFSALVPVIRSTDRPSSKVLSSTSHEAKYGQKDGFYDKTGPCRCCTWKAISSPDHEAIPLSIRSWTVGHSGLSDARSLLDPSKYRIRIGEDAVYMTQSPAVRARLRTRQGNCSKITTETIANDSIDLSSDQKWA